MSAFILNSDTPMTISIQGDWGSGKTSMMNMIKEKISSEVYPIWFNTWQFSQFEMQNELTVSMLYYFLSQLDCDKDGLRKIVGALGGAVRLATSFAAEKTLGSAAAGDILNSMGGGVHDYPEEIRKLKVKFQETVNDKLTKLRKNRVVIFVDDLDRLQPQKAVELLEVLKTFLDCENCVYVLAVDYDIVTQGIRQKFGENVDAKKGRSFFDKIIQLPFKVPTAQYDISGYVADMLAKMGVNADRPEDFVRLISLSIGCNPRSIKRLFNTYLLLDIMLRDRLQAQGDSEMNLMLFAIICVQMEFDSLYQYIISCADTLDREFLLELESNLAVNESLREILGDDESELLRISGFMKCLNEILNIAEEETAGGKIEKLKSLLSFSTVTSVGSETALEEKSEFDWKYRYQNKDIAKEVNALILQSTGKEFAVWQPRKNTQDRRISDTWGTMPAEYSGVKYEFDYILRTNYAIGVTEVSIEVYCVKPTSPQEFDRFFDASPLELACAKSEGAYVYESVCKFADSEVGKATSEIKSVIEDALRKMDSFLEKK